ncbi:hypothetical protein tb265_30040 [Gemmatimonadetes bacterium T265]|nr:hypothetical protein tb265_30040 [Gemmatimonadetes bacterium T265]
MSDDEAPLAPELPAPEPPEPPAPELLAPVRPVLSGAETVQYIALGVLAFFGLPLVGVMTYGIGFLLGVGWLGWTGARAWRRDEPSRARVRRFLVGLLLGLVIFGGCTVLVLSNLGNMH